MSGADKLLRSTFAGSNVDAHAGPCTSTQAHGAILAGDVQPLGVPAVFLQELLVLDHRAARLPHRPAELEARIAALAGDYRQAQGYGMSWGQLHEARLGEATAWRVIPVKLWMDQDLERLRSRGGLAALTSGLHALVRQRISPNPGPAVVRAGCSGGGQRVPYALLSILCLDESGLAEARAWMASEFLRSTWPDILRDCQGWVEQELGSGP